MQQQLSLFDQHAAELSTSTTPIPATPAIDIRRADGTKVYVFTDNDFLFQDEYLLRPEGRYHDSRIRGGDGLAGKVDKVVTKTSQQLSASGAVVTRWAGPRINPNDLLLFFDWNVWHRRSVIVKALLVGGLGWHLEMDGKVVYDPRKGMDQASEHPAVRLVKRPNPNRMETLDELVFRHLVDFFSTGNAYPGSLTKPASCSGDGLSSCPCGLAFTYSVHWRTPVAPVRIGGTGRRSGDGR